MKGILKIFETFPTKIFQKKKKNKKIFNFLKNFMGLPLL